MQQDFSAKLKSHFLRLYQIAFSDDDFDILELQMLYEFARDRGIPKEQLDHLLLNPTLESALPETLDERIEYLYDLSLMIWADNKVTEDERNTLKKYASKFEFLDENIEELTNFLLENAQKKTSIKDLLNEIND